MTRRSRPVRGMLRKQLGWFVTLRWIAITTLVLGALFERQVEWFGGIAAQFLAVAGIILIYNALLATVLPRARSRRVLRALALAQLLLDMLALTALVTWTGGTRSPLIAFFVFHMVFSSLLLSRELAYACAAAAAVLITGGLAISGSFPSERNDRLALVGIIITLVLTVTLTNRITRDLHAHRRRLIRQNHRIQGMSNQLRRHQQALVQHEKMVAMGRMAAGVTHEIANPLASMDSLLQLLQRRPERFKPDTIQSLRDQVHRINQIIQQMKTFAHPAESQPQDMPLEGVIQQSLEMVRFDARVKRIDIHREFDPQAAGILVSPRALQQVLVNLIGNALDAMASVEKPVLTIRTQRRDEWCVIDVADNGHGVDPEHMPRLFEPFFTTKPIGKGTGLGLSISYSLMQRQGGSISVRSQSGVGTTFTLRLPVKPVTSRLRESSAAPFGGGENPAD